MKIDQWPTQFAKVVGSEICQILDNPLKYSHTLYG